MQKLTIVLSILLLTTTAFGFETPASFENNTQAIKGMVFLSKNCPCSNSHVDHINEMAKKYKDIALYGVITDAFDDSSEKEIQEYFTGARFGFPIIKDPEQVLVKKYGALKTPHAILLAQNKEKGYDVIYNGGVTDGHKFLEASQYFLKENLAALNAKKPIPYAQGRCLGCYIKRI